MKNTYANGNLRDALLFLVHEIASPDHNTAVRREADAKAVVRAFLDRAPSRRDLISRADALAPFEGPGELISLVSVRERLAAVQSPLALPDRRPEGIEADDPIAYGEEVPEEGEDAEIDAMARAIGVNDPPSRTWEEIGCIDRLEYRRMAVAARRAMLAMPPRASDPQPSLEVVENVLLASLAAP